MWCGVVWFGMGDIVQYGVVWCGCFMVRCSVVWCGVAVTWYGVVQCGVVWLFHGMVVCGSHNAMFYLGPKVLWVMLNEWK